MADNCKYPSVGEVSEFLRRRQKARRRTIGAHKLFQEDGETQQNEVYIQGNVVACAMYPAALFLVILAALPTSLSLRGFRSVHLPKRGPTDVGSCSGYLL